ncbi:hypothetical protein P154DRAFT_518154 [Amniculicola lignicola CBS 123094]|uniref:Uncharacterized protein n=1 Tax=Amniculicola lignicola CBS 123094 TaxID=1392246 RepID=A0A6A5WWC4_9PLEO|nr:hypothetical protein P154DRAFT_518154 [Amniculicola lignicola CBS 123094]
MSSTARLRSEEGGRIHEAHSSARALSPLQQKLTVGDAPGPPAPKYEEGSIAITTQAPRAPEPSNFPPLLQVSRYKECM